MPTLPSLVAAAVLALAACSSVAPSADAGTRIADGSTFRMAMGQSVTLADGSTLRYTSLVNDSRCQPDVQCVWAGDAEVAFAWHSAGGGRDAFSLHTGRGDKSHTIGARTVTLVALARGVAPEATLRVESGG